MNKTYTLSLTRWHKIAERLTKSFSEMAVALKEGFCNTRVCGYAGQEQIRRLQAHSTELEAQYDLVLELERHVVAIRQALAQANAEHGVATELARYDWLMRRQRLLQALLDGQSLNMVSVADLQETELRISGSDEDVYGRQRTPQLDIRLMRESFEERLLADLACVQAEGYALSDAIAERNRATVTIELPEPIARLAGLA